MFISLTGSTAGMNKHFDPQTKFTQGYLNEAGVRVFPSVDELSQKFGVSRSSLFKKCQKEDWHSERLQFQKRLAAELSKQTIASSINKAETIDNAILRIAARGLQLVEEKLNKDGPVIIRNRAQAPLRERHRGSKAHSGSYPFDDEKGQCLDLDECTVYRSSPQSMPRFTIYSTRKGHSQHAVHSSLTVMLLYLSGVHC